MRRLRPEWLAVDGTPCPGHGRQRLILNLDEFSSINCLRMALCDDTHHSLADKAHAPLRQNRTQRIDDSMAGKFCGATQRPKLTGFRLDRRQDGQHTRRLSRRSNID
jgi:hypothetical protein